MLKEVLPDYDEDGNGNYKSEEIQAAVDGISSNGKIYLPKADGRTEKVYLTEKQKAVLWQLLVSTKSAKNNPYDVETGWKVLDKMKGEG